MIHTHQPSRGHYVHGCRHPDCRKANSEYSAQYRAARHARGVRCPSAERAYHAAAVAAWRANRTQRKNTPPRRYNP